MGYPPSRFGYKTRKKRISFGVWEVGNGRTIGFTVSSIEHVSHTVDSRRIGVILAGKKKVGAYIKYAVQGAAKEMAPI